MSVPARPPIRPWALGLIVAGLVVVAQALLIPLFSVPAANLQPRDLPVVVAGPPQAIGPVIERLEADRPGAFTVTTAPDATSADRALRDREAYAAIVVAPDGPTLHIASAASTTVATLLTQATGSLAPGGAVPVVDVVATDPDDPRGAGFASGFLPLALTSMLAGMLLFLRVTSRVGRLAGLAVYAVLAGLAGAAVLQAWLGLLPGDYLANAAVIGLLALAASSFVAGLGSAIGYAGVGLGALIVFLLGNPLSGVNAAPELLPQPWGELGQWLPVGAGATLLRSTAFFDGAGGSAAALVLIGYAVLGLALTAVGRAGIARPVTGAAGPDADARPTDHGRSVGVA